MTSLGHALTGAFFVTMAFVVGIAVLEDAPAIGWLLILVGIVRGGLAVRQLVEGLQPREERLPASRFDDEVDGFDDDEAP